MGYSYPAVGAHLAEKNQCRFTVWAPLQENVKVKIDENTHPMTRDERGFWTATVPAAEGALYKFVLGNGNELPDPASRCQPKGVHGPSQIVSSEYQWSDEGWKGLSLSEMIIYELHVGTFTSEHTFKGVASKLDYLQTLGVNAIEIMPVSQFPGERNWGYDGVYPFAVQYSYGGPTGLKALVDEAHKKGIAVILDVVYNHQGPEGNYLSAYGPYFTEKYKTGWGSAINYDDAYCDGVRHFYWQNALMWLDEYHIDGLRLDAVHAIWDNSANHFINELRKKVRDLEAKTGTKKVLIAEFDLNNPRYISGPEEGGYGLDGQWIDEFHHSLHSIVTGEVDGYYEDFGETHHLAKSIQESYVYTGQYSVHRKKLFGAPAIRNSHDQFVVFAQNHDQVGNRMLGDRLTQQLSFEALKLTAATYLLAPQVPMLFMGEEYGETNPFQYFISHTDEKLIEATRKGRKEEFSYFNWKGEVPDPQSANTFNACVLSWQIEKNSRSSVLLDFYKALIAFRKSHPALRARTKESIKIHPLPTEKIIAYERQSGDSKVLIILNFEKSKINYPVKAKGKIALDSSEKKWDGPGGSSNSEDHVQMAPESVVVIELNK